jgi:hypothetical protein
MLTKKSLIMKWLNRTLVCIFIVFFLFFAFYKPKGINFEGTWKAKEIVLDGKKNYPDTLASFIDYAPEIVVNHWSKTIVIPVNRKNITAKFQYINEESNQHKIRLFTTEKSLNHIFAISIDTLNTGPQSYFVNVELKSNTTLLKIQKHVIIPPWKPEFPKKGRP